jgi:integrase
LEEKQITVLAEISKTKEERTVPIEPTLLEWFAKYAPAPNKRKGYITEQTNFKNYTLQIHIAAGFRGSLTTTKDGKKTTTLHNPTSPAWIPDILRHSYGSYWLKKHGNRAQLAENMGNSLQIIKKHYKRPVKNSDTALYWAILPIGAIASKEKELAEISARF